MSDVSSNGEKQNDDQNIVTEQLLKEIEQESSPKFEKQLQADKMKNDAEKTEKLPQQFLTTTQLQQSNQLVNEAMN